MNTELKLCVDCKHYRHTAISHQKICIRDNVKIGINLVTGTDLYTNKVYNAKDQRKDGVFWLVNVGACGKRAKFFEEKTE